MSGPIIIRNNIKEALKGCQWNSLQEHVGLPDNFEFSRRPITLWKPSSLDQMERDRENRYLIREDNPLATSLGYLQHINQVEEGLNIPERCRTFALLQREDNSDRDSPIVTTERVFIFLHGLGGSPGYFREIAEEIWKCGHNVVALREKGHGMPPTSDNSHVLALNNVTLGDHYDTGHLAAAIGEGLGRKTEFVGFSHGAVVLLGAALQQKLENSSFTPKEGEGAISNVYLISPPFSLQEFSAAVNGNQAVATTLLRPFVMSVFLGNPSEAVWNEEGAQSETTYPFNPLRTIGWSGHLCLSVEGDIRRASKESLKGLNVVLITNPMDSLVDNLHAVTVLRNLGKKGASINSVELDLNKCGVPEGRNLPHNFFAESLVRRNCGEGVAETIRQQLCREFAI